LCIFLILHSSILRSLGGGGPLLGQDGLIKLKFAAFGPMRRQMGPTTWPASWPLWWVLFGPLWRFLLTL
jgi:hypothetical protein